MRRSALPCSPTYEYYSWLQHHGFVPRYVCSRHSYHFMVDPSFQTTNKHLHSPLPFHYGTVRARPGALKIFIRTLKWHLTFSVYRQYFFRIFVKAKKLKKKKWIGRISYIMLPAMLFISRYMWLIIYSFFKMFIISYFRFLPGQLPVNNGWYTSSSPSTTVGGITC